MSIDDWPLQRHDVDDLPAGVSTMQGLLALALLLIMLPFYVVARLLRSR